MTPDTLRTVRDKLTRVFRYLEALNQHRNPATREMRDQPWALWLSNLPDHPSVQLGAARSEAAAQETQTASGSGESNGSGEDFVLKVQRPKLSRPPEPPWEIAGWLESGWDDPAHEPGIREPKNVPGPAGDGPRAMRFADDPIRPRALQRWKLQRDEWAREEKPARASMKIFEMLYGLHSRLDREGERVELVLGDGILNWRRPEGNIHHPILLQRLHLGFNAAIPEFTLSETEHPVELYSALFQSMNDVDGRAIGRCREELEQGGYHPRGDDTTSGFLRRVVLQLSPRGDFVSSGAPEGERDYPRIGRDPVVFLRNRTLGFAAAIEGVLDDLRTREDLPWSLLNIVGEQLPSYAPEAAASAPALPTAADVLLSKPANPEQIRIARQLEEHGGVLVQGPPGTGKTHTIGNLIGHLLAQGKSVLVTSHTTKALRMVRHHIVPELRPLCVSVLESDLDSRRQLESAVGGIAERLSRADAGTFEIDAGRLDSERHELLSLLEDVRRQMTGARADEYRDVVIDGQSWPPADAARKVAQEKEQHGWLPGPVGAGSSLPLSEGELADLYRTGISISREDEDELSGRLPEPAELFRPEDFEAAVRERKRLHNLDLEFRSDLWPSPAAEGSHEQMEALAANLMQAIEPLAGNESWKLAAIYAGRHGGSHRHPWDQLIHEVQIVHSEAAGAQEPLLKYGPVLPGDLHFEQHEQITSEILDHLRQGGKLGGFALLRHRQWKQFIESARVSGGPPRRAEHFDALHRLARLQTMRRELAARWDRQAVPLGAPAASEMEGDLEKNLLQFCGSLQDCLQWHEMRWIPLQQELENLGFQWEKFMAEQPAIIGPWGELARIERSVKIALLPVLAARSNLYKWAHLEKRLRDLAARLEAASRSFDSSRVIAQLASAVARRDDEGYRTAYARLLELKSRQSDLDLRRTLLAKMESAAPAWAAAIRNRKGIHGRREVPGDAAAAWLWRQIGDELDRRASVSLEALQGRSEQLREQLQRVTVELIDRRAWAFQSRRTSSHQRQSLVGWLDTIRRIGKGHGVRVPLLRAEAARKMSECRGAVPVWIMPLSRVVENFDPRMTRFDVVIVDEASQSDVMALVALYLGKTVLVVGDHEQVSPSAVGQDLGIIQNLIFQYLQGIPNADLYDGQISIYDLARQSFGGTTCLVEHFRCVPEIVQFSNMISYDGRIKPLRDASRVELRPHTIAHRVSGSSRDGKINRQEALEVASLIAAAIEQPEYQIDQSGAPVSFGAVSLVGDEQAIEIEGLLRAHLLPEQYERHRLLCGNAAQFQGDERDVIFISLVDTAGRGALPLRDQQMFKQRFNVAASRARDQMWVVHSLDPARDVKAGDLRRQLIEHAQDPTPLMLALEEKEKRAPSQLERAVMKRLRSAGYRATPQWRVGAYRIDLVVEGGGRRLAIECDGDRYRPLEKLGEDMERQAVLERVGWAFTRVRCTEFLRDPARAMKPVLEKLRLLAIPMEADLPESEPMPSISRDLTARVIRRAEALRKRWAKSDESGAERHAAAEVESLAG